MKNVMFKRNGRMVAAKDILKMKEGTTVEEVVVASVEEKAVVAKDTTEINALRVEYKAKFEKDVPVNKKNNAEWIQSKLAE